MPDERSREGWRKVFQAKARRCEGHGGAIAENELYLIFQSLMNAVGINRAAGTTP